MLIKLSYFLFPSPITTSRLWITALQQQKVVTTPGKCSSGFQERQRHRKGRTYVHEERNVHVVPRMWLTRFWNGLVKTWKDWLQLLALTVVPNHSENHRFLSLRHWRIYHPLVQTLAKQNHLPFYAVRQPRKIFLLKLIFKTTKQSTTSYCSFSFSISCAVIIYYCPHPICNQFNCKLYTTCDATVTNHKMINKIFYMLK